MEYFKNILKIENHNQNIRNSGIWNSWNIKKNHYNTWGRKVKPGYKAVLVLYAHARVGMSW